MRVKLLAVAATAHTRDEIDMILEDLQAFGRLQSKHPPDQRPVHWLSSNRTRGHLAALRYASLHDGEH